MLPAFQSFNDIPTARLLSRAVLHQHLSHAYIFKGRQKIGLQLALALAQSLFCPQQGCGSCPICISIQGAHFPDLYLIEGEGTGQKPTLKLAQIKRLVQQVALPPVQADYQIFVLCDADNMNKESGNALLKTLEEPASDTILILLSQNLEYILPTLRSRSQILTLGRNIAQSEELLQQSEVELWHWDKLEKIKSRALLSALETHLLELQPTDLHLQMMLFQRQCWEKIQPFILEKNSIAGLNRARSYLQLFDDCLNTLRTHAHPKLLITSFTQDFFAIRSQR